MGEQSIKLKVQKGFTLIELLTVIIIIVTLAVVVFVAINPLKRIKDARDAKRTADIATILTAVHISIIDSKGSLPSGLTTSMAETQLGTAGTGCAVSTNGCAATPAACLDMSTALSKYLKSIPTDPNGGTAATTNYTIGVDANNIVTVKACGAEGGTNILQSR